jgi:hypothetical protein
MALIAKESNKPIRVYGTFRGVSTRVSWQVAITRECTDRVETSVALHDSNLSIEDECTPVFWLPSVNEEDFCRLLQLAALLIDGFGVHCTAPAGHVQLDVCWLDGWMGGWMSVLSRWCAGKHRKQVVEQVVDVVEQSNCTRNKGQSESRTDLEVCSPFLEHSVERRTVATEKPQPAKLTQPTSEGPQQPAKRQASNRPNNRAPAP